LFSHEGELVLEPFLGSGTTLVAAARTNRNAVGFDLQEPYVNIARKRAGANISLWNTTEQVAILDDAMNINQHIEPKTVKLVVTSPPYANVLNKPRLNKGYRDGHKRDNYKKVEQYSDLSNDLGTMDPDMFTEKITEIFQGIHPLMRDDGHLIINIADIYDK
jgi:DNA modification methylase